MIEVDDVIIDGRRIGPDSAPYVIAEISANHGGSLDDACALIAAAAAAGADAVKFQHYTPDTITVRSTHPDFVVRGGTLWDGRQLAELYAEAMTPWEWTEQLAASARSAGITWFSSPFDETAVDFLAAHDVPAFKIASFEIVDLPLIRHAASHGRPLIISTGMATVAEIDAAVEAAAGTEVILLRCNSGYPAAADEMDLAAIPAMAERWKRPIGFSDHTLGHVAAIAAVALGSAVVEKHLTMRRSGGGPDAAFSAEPGELAELIEAVRTTQLAIGGSRFGPSDRELASIAFRPSLRALRSIGAGAVITEADVGSRRPAGGLLPNEIEHVLGQVARHDLGAGDPIGWDDLDAPVGGR